jgi:hypothetical protein
VSWKRRSFTANLARRSRCKLISRFGSRCRRLIRWARRQKRRVGVRLVKGAYWDSEIAWAKQKNWPIPVFLDKAETDANYEKLSRLLLENHDVIDAAFGSHNLRSLSHAIVAAKELGVPLNGYEIQVLYGMAEPVRRAIIENGQRVRVYLPAGELLPGISYLIRRLMENTSNTSFLRQTYADKKDVISLLKAPAAAVKPAAQVAREQGGFGRTAYRLFAPRQSRAFPPDARRNSRRVRNPAQAQRRFLAGRSAPIERDRRSSAEATVDDAEGHRRARASFNGAYAARSAPRSARRRHIMRERRWGWRRGNSSKSAGVGADADVASDRLPRLLRAPDAALGGAARDPRTT